MLGDLYAIVDGVRPVDRTDVEFVTLDPASSTDLDQAFWIGADGDDVVLSYAIADVARFVEPGGHIDVEAWRRGVTVYLPDDRAGLHPPRLAEDAASLLPDVERPAVVFTVRVDPAGLVRLERAQRSVIRSRAKLAYSTVTLGDLPAGVRRTRPAHRAGGDRARCRACRGPGTGSGPHPGRLRVAVPAALGDRGAERGAVVGDQHGGRRRVVRRPHGRVPDDGRCRRRAHRAAAEHGEGVRARVGPRAVAGGVPANAPDRPPEHRRVPARRATGRRSGTVRALRRRRRPVARGRRRDIHPRHRTAAAVGRSIRDRGGGQGERGDADTGVDHARPSGGCQR